MRLVYDSAAVRTLSNKRDREAVLARLAKLHPNQKPAWGRMSAHEMVCHLSDSFRASLGEKHVTQYGSFFQPRSSSGWLCGFRFAGRTASRHRLKWISEATGRDQQSLLQTLKSCGFYLSASANREVTLRRTPFSARCQKASVCVAATCAWIIICGSSEYDTRLLALKRGTLQSTARNGARPGGGPGRLWRTAAVGANPPGWFNLALSKDPISRQIYVRERTNGCG